MSLPKFSSTSNLSPSDLKTLLINRVRIERRRLKMTQAEFAARCGIPLRTYKRFELGESDSLEALVRIVVVFKRVAAFDLLFPADAVELESKSPIKVLERVMIQNGVKNITSKK